jgi:hypothetical protein
MPTPIVPEAEQVRSPGPLAPPPSVADVSGRVVAMLAAEGLLPDQYHAVYLAGSLVRGWGNDSSDLDCYVVTDIGWESPTAQRSEVDLEPHHVLTESRYLSTRRWEIQYWLDRQVDQMLAKVTDVNREAEITRVDAVFLRRLGYATPEAGSVWLERRREQVAASRITTVVAANALQSMDVCVEDAFGQLTAGDLDSAVISARLAFGYAVEAALADRGEFEESAKWRARRMRVANPSALPFAQYWAIETMRDFDPAAPGTWVRHVLEICQHIAMEVNLA